MPSTFTGRLRFEKQANGENDSTWGTKLDTVLDLIDDSVAGMAAVVMAADADYSLTTNNSATDEARMAILSVTSGVALTATRNITVPTQTKKYVVKNSTTGGKSLTVKTAAGTGITVPNGKTAHLACDGVNVINAFDYADTLTAVAGNLSIVDGADQSKVVKISAAALTTGNTRTITAPDADTKLPIAAQVLTWLGLTAARSMTLPDASSTLVARDSTDTLTNKTVDTAGPNTIKVNGNTLAAAAGVATVTLPNATDQLVGRSTNDTLTNKVLTSAVLNTGVSGTALAVKADQQNGTSTTLLVTTARQGDHDSAAKATITYNGGGASISASFNVTSVTKNAAGNYTVNLTNPFSSGNYTVVPCGINTGGNNTLCCPNGTSTGSFSLFSTTVAAPGVGADNTVHAVAYGRQ